MVIQESREEEINAALKESTKTARPYLYRGGRSIYPIGGTWHAGKEGGKHSEALSQETGEEEDIPWLLDANTQPSEKIHRRDQEDHYSSTKKKHNSSGQMG